MDSLAFKKHLQYLIMNQLKPKKRSISATGHIIIKKKMFDRLKEDFGVTGRYKSNAELMLYLEMNRHLNRTEYCFFKNETFQVRVSNEKTVSFLDKNMCKKKYTGGFGFWYRFIRYEAKV